MSKTAKGLTLSASVIALMLTSAGAAFAAQPPADDDASEVEELVVTGFRGSLAQALNQKREETSVVDAISAEDIADFPDTNLAEAVQRIPGVSIDRDAGEGRTITVRGLGPDFTRTRINGMEAQATTGATDSSGGANRGRGFDFNVFAAELFQNVTVRKTSAAEVEEGSLGATVDLTTSRPFDAKNAAVINAQYGYNDLSEGWDPRISGLWSHLFADGTIGLLGSVAYSERNLFEEGYSSVRWAPVTEQGGFCSPLGFTPQAPANSGTNGSSATHCATNVPRPANTPANVAAYNTAMTPGTFIPRLPRYGRLVHDQSRLGMTGSAQWQPTDRTKVTLDLLYSKVDASRQENFLEAMPFSRNANAGGQPQVHVVSATVDPDGTLSQGMFNNVDVRVEQRSDELTSEFNQISFNVEHDITDEFRVRGFIGRAESNFDNPVQTTVTFDRQNSQGFGWDYVGHPNTPLITWGFDPADPASWAWRDASLGTGITSQLRSEIRLRPNSVDTVFDALGLDFEADASENFVFKFGLNHKKFDSTSVESRRADETVVPALPAGVTVADISQNLTGFGSGLGLPAGSSTAWLVPDLNAIADLYDIYCNCNTGAAGGDFRLTSITNGNARGSNRQIIEESTGGYLQLDGRGEVFGKQLRGNVGVRYVVTDLTAHGYSSAGGGTPVTGTNNYGDLLPSLNLAMNVTDDFILRFGAAKVMARPQIGNTLSGANYLVPVVSITTGANYTATVGNVDLQPFRAATYDLSAEWYFAPESLLSVAIFYKDIESYIQQIRRDATYGALMSAYPEFFPLSSCISPGGTPVGGCSLTQQFQFTTAVNTEGGPLRGIEISYQQPFTFLPGFFKDFGVQLNYTHVESEIDYCGNATCSIFLTDELQNLSPNSYNATIYYENPRFSARVSASYRDDYLQNTPGRNGNDFEGKAETLNVDASATFNVNEKLAITFEALNLTDEFNRQFVSKDDRESTSVYHHTGRQFFIGARYRFQ